MGIEPTYPAWKAGVLPLNYTRMKIYDCFKAHHLFYNHRACLVKNILFHLSQSRK